MNYRNTGFVKDTSRRKGNFTPERVNHTPQPGLHGTLAVEGVSPFCFKGRVYIRNTSDLDAVIADLQKLRTALR